MDNLFLWRLDWLACFIFALAETTNLDTYLLHITKINKLFLFWMEIGALWPIVRLVSPRAFGLTATDLKD